LRSLIDSAINCRCAVRAPIVFARANSRSQILSCRKMKYSPLARSLLEFTRPGLVDDQSFPSFRAIGIKWVEAATLRETNWHWLFHLLTVRSLSASTRA